MDSHTVIHLFHILIVGSLFIYLGINRENIYKPLFKVLLILGLLIISYHLYKAYSYFSKGRGFWVNLIHIFIVGPLLV